VRTDRLKRSSTIDDKGAIMSNLSLNKLRPGRGQMLASAAVLALVASAALGEATLSSSSPAHAAAVATTDLQEQRAPSFANLIDRVKPAVVSVKVTIDSAGMSSDDTSGQLDNVPPGVQDFLKKFGVPNDQLQSAPSRPMMGEGSGFFISADGYVVTNNHVVQHAKSVTVTTNDGKTLTAKVVGTDPKTDLAVIKVSEPGDYPFVTFAKGAPRVGDWVVAIGNPFGLGGTATAGIVSADGRDIGQGPYDRFLQIDAPINKGNSGGPTFNLQGQVVGVNTAIYSPSGGSVGLGFAIPASTVDGVVNALEHGGVVTRGFLGVSIQPVTQDIADSLGLKTSFGAIVDATTPGTPAAQSGLRPGDVITKVNEEPVKDAADLTRQIGEFKPGVKVQLTYMRDGAQMSADVTLAAQKAEKVVASATASDNGAGILGVKIAAASEVSGAGDKGVAIVNVDPNGAAASKGISEGDVILQVAGKPVSTPDEVKSGISSAMKDGKKAVLMQVKTASGERFVAFELPKA
jgi:serine protease Do